ncbi:dihydroneopterin aldolase [Falsirhodobacter sp. alg1]|uniref:dihydroneopterin aldolase n=1 Tax=Falsirhodobacter sp. alg1 TaxID=1472418 RepID=UPI0005EF187F|nr:dihydroneopterin aldolase [Falsirhodobacter sp. alg1]
MIASDIIFLRDHVVDVEIGAFEIERHLSQRLRFAVEVEVLAVAAGDNVDRILSYDRIVEAITDELASARVNLLETLAEGVAARILAHRQAHRVQIEIEKLDRGPFVLGVRIVRQAGSNAISPQQMQTAATPHLVWLGASGKSPVRGALNVIAASAPSAQRVQDRLDLLAMDMAAWKLADTHEDVAVGASRTEIDWAVRQGQAVVWAPSRMVLDAAQPPASMKPEALLLWLAGQFGVGTITAFDTLSAESRIAVRQG